MTLVPGYLPGHLNVLADHLSRRGQILKTEWSLNQTIADRIFRAWGRPFVDLFALGKNTKLDLQSRLAILWWTNTDNLRRGVPLGTIDVEYYLYSDSSTQGWVPTCRI